MVDFDPAHLTGEATLNRTVVASIDGIPEGYHGKTGMELLSADALREVPDADTPREVGERLAALLVTLRTGGDGDGRGPDPSPWRIAYLRWWQRTSEVWLGGGGAARCGQPVADVCVARLRDLGDDLDVTVHPHAASMPLIGAARSVAATEQRVAVFDFGHTSVKRGYGAFDDEGRLATLELCPPVEVDTSFTSPDEVRSFALEVVEETLSAVGASTAAFSVAAYIDRDGVIADGRSFYNPLGDDEGEGLRAIVRHATGAASDLVVLHDGTAAARAITARTDAAAAVTLGTALGVGFLPPDVELAPLSDAFDVVGE